MAKKYDWGDGNGAIHNIPLSQHQTNSGGYSGNDWNPAWLMANAPTGTVIPGAGIATGPGTAQADVNPMAEGQYGIDTGNADNAYNHSISNDQYGEATTANDYGYTPVYGADGFVDTTATEAGGVDPSNPFSKMALLSRAYQQQKSSTTNGYAAMGQLYSSAIGDQRGADQFNNDQAVDSAKKAFEAAMHGYTQDRVGAGDAKNNAYSTAGWNRLNTQTGGS